MRPDPPGHTPTPGRDRHHGERQADRGKQGERETEHRAVSEAGHRERTRFNAVKHGMGRANSPSSRPPPPMPSPIGSRSWARRIGLPTRPANGRLDREPSPLGPDRSAAGRLSAHERPRAPGAKVRASVAWDQDRAVEAATLFGRLAKDPFLVARQLETTLHGVRMLIDAWFGLTEPLEAGRDWSDDEASRGTRPAPGVALDTCPIGPDADRGPRGDRRPRLSPRRDPRRDRFGRLEAVRDEVMAPLDEMNRQIAMEGDLALLSKPAQLAMRYERDAWKRYREAMKVLQAPTPAPMPIPMPVAPIPPAIAARPKASNNVRNESQFDRGTPEGGAAADRQGHGNPGKLHRHAPADRRGRGSRMAQGSREPAARLGDGTKPISSRPRRPGVRAVCHRVANERSLGRDSRRLGRDPALWNCWVSTQPTRGRGARRAEENRCINAGQHQRPNFFVIVHGENKVSPPRSLEHLVRAPGLSLDRPSDPEKNWQGLKWSKANGSCDNRKEVVEFGDTLAMFESIREDPQSKGLHARNRFLACLPVNRDAGKRGDLRDPASIVFLFRLDRQVRGVVVSDDQTPTFFPAPTRRRRRFLRQLVLSEPGSWRG